MSWFVETLVDIVGRAYMLIRLKEEREALSSDGPRELKKEDFGINLAP